MKFMLITNHEETARRAIACGVDRIFVDLEVNGKHERQGHLDTFISKHHQDDVARIRAAVPTAELLVRLNPLYEGSAGEIDRAIAAGADLLMLPMFSNEEELATFCALVNGRAGVVPLLETPGAQESIANWVGLRGITEIYIGLNDLHLARGLDFMFEVLACGWVDEMSDVIKAAGLPFGFGGIARVGEGLLPGERVLAEHVRLGSSSVILSRTFCRQPVVADTSLHDMDLDKEISSLRLAEAQLRLRTLEQTRVDSDEISATINEIAATLRHNKVGA